MERHVALTPRLGGACRRRSIRVLAKYPEHACALGVGMPDTEAGARRGRRRGDAVERDDSTLSLSSCLGECGERAILGGAGMPDGDGRMDGWKDGRMGSARGWSEPLKRTHQPITAPSRTAVNFRALQAGRDQWAGRRNQGEGTHRALGRKRYGRFWHGGRAAMRRLLTRTGPEKHHVPPSLRKQRWPIAVGTISLFLSTIRAILYI